jgi:protein TonB
MLEDCLFDSRSSARSKKPATLAVSVLVHGVIAGALIVIPLFQTQLLPQVPLFDPLPPPVGGGGRVVELVPVSGGPSPTIQSAAIQEPRELVEPIRIPPTLAVIVEGPVSSIGDIAGPPGRGGTLGGSSGLPTGVDFSLPSKEAAPPPPPPAEPPPPPRPPQPDPAPEGPVRIVSSLMQSKLLDAVKPTYPRLAVIARVEDTVVIEAVITREGTISNLRVLKGHPLLNDAAIEAVKQWRYRPTILNGVPVEVLTNITVTFTLK